MNIDKDFSRLGGITPIEGETFVPVKNTEILAIERQLRCRLPSPYREFLEKYGACRFYGASADHPFIKVNPIVPLPSALSPDGTALFSAFYGGERDSHDAFSIRVRMDYFHRRMPDTMIPIGDAGLGDQICLGIRESDTGKVYFWDSQDEPLDEETYLEDFGSPMPSEAKRKNVYLLAESFDSFLDRLECSDE